MQLSQPALNEQHSTQHHPLADQVTHIVPEVGVSPLGEEQLNNRAMSLVGSPHQRSHVQLSEVKIHSYMQNTASTIN